MNIEMIRHEDQWCIHGHIDLDPQWRIMFRNPTRNYADLTKTHGGLQWEPAPIYGLSRLDRLAQRLLNQAGIARTITAVWKSWCIDYAPGGYQDPHQHGSALITSVLYFDQDSSETILQIGQRELKFSSTPGRFILFDGLTTHWGTPVQVRKRVLVTDWEYREFTAEIQTNRSDQV